LKRKRREEWKERRRQSLATPWGERDAEWRQRER
jgi:hypothetical protein